MKLADLKGKTVGGGVSGGLDSKTICCVLKDAGVKVKAFSANVGQPDEKDINDIKKRMAPTGVDTVIVDVTKEMADICFETVKCQAMYDGGYWNSTGIARAVTVQKLLPAMKKAGCVALVHGATGRGNDQMPRWWGWNSRWIRCAAAQYPNLPVNNLAGEQLCGSLQAVPV